MYLLKRSATLSCIGILANMENGRIVFLGRNFDSSVLFLNDQSMTLGGSVSWGVKEDLRWIIAIEQVCCPSLWTEILLYFTIGSEHCIIYCSHGIKPRVSFVLSVLSVEQDVYWEGNEVIERENQIILSRTRNIPLNLMHCHVN
jgi:hypothetical protein